METKEEVYKACTIEGMVVKLPNEQLDRKLYQEVAKGLELIGGKWNRKAAGFTFLADPTELLAQLAEGTKRNLKKEFQFFETPADLADELVALANIVSWGSMILEPSAGQGAIIKAIQRKVGVNGNIHYCELMDINRSFLRKIERTIIIGNDFLLLEDCYNNYFDNIVANPPFKNNQDIDHIKKMYNCLKSGGTLVSVASEHWKISTNKKESEFCKWLDKVDADVIPIEKGTFKESGTLVGGYIIKITK